jgi:ribosomal protein L25 (general stress protein Ctc)
MLKHIIYHGKKTNTGKQKVNEVDFIKALKTSTTIRQALINLGLAPKGGNYNRAKKVMMKYNLN